MTAEYRPKSLVIVRHAQSLWNKISPSHRGQATEASPEMKGIPDHRTPLTETGMEQARATGRGLAEMFGDFDVVYHSPWLRTTETAKLIIGEFPEPFRSSMRARTFRNLFLVEQRFGDLDIGVSDELGLVEENRARYEKFSRWRRIVGKFYATPPNGQAWDEVCKETDLFLLSALYRSGRDGQKVLIVTHGVRKQTFRYHLEGMDEERLVEEYHRDKPKNCGVSHYEWDEAAERYALRFWNKTFYETPSE